MILHLDFFPTQGTSNTSSSLECSFFGSPAHTKPSHQSTFSSPFAGGAICFPELSLECGELIPGENASGEPVEIVAVAPGEESG